MENLSEMIATAKTKESWSANGKYNYGPIEFLRNYILYANNGRDAVENMNKYESNLHHVTTPDTYAAYLLCSYDVYVDETQVYCDIRRVFPSLTFREICNLISDHMGENQQGDGIATVLVPDCIILASSDDYTREMFRKRHDKFYKLSSYWHGDKLNTDRVKDLRKKYDRESLAVHFLLSHELFYSWTDNRLREDCLSDVKEIFPDMTANELHDIRDKYAAAISKIYG